ncbi:MAG: aldehyde dehydrogenase family protein [Polyangiaceae bacterium]
MQQTSESTTGATTSTTATASAPTTGARDRILSFAPATGELVGEAPVHDAAAVRAAVERARRAQVSWGALPVRDRCERMLRLRDLLLEREAEVSDLIARETGKPVMEALLHEVAPTLHLLEYFAKHAEKILAPREVPLSLVVHRKSVLYYAPRGVVGVISPWNFPFLLPMRDILLAVFAGNAVVLKPSEITPTIALRMKQLWDRAGLPADLFQVVTGYGATGAALIDAGIQLCVFTGGVATGKRVAAACGERLIPCVMELGGKAPLIVCRDADVELAARAAVFGGFANAGQVCISVERVYVHREVAERFTSRVVELTRELRVGDSRAGAADVGAITFPKQIDIAEAHIADAVSKGAEILVGGKRKLDPIQNPASPSGSRGPGAFFEPTVLGGCDHHMTVMTEEIFGPIVPIMRVSSDEEALRFANSSHLGLNAYVFTRDRAYGERLASQVEAGSILVNDVLMNAALPEVPFGGVKQSGFGRVLGDDSLREMCDVRHVNVDRFPMGSKNPLWYPYTERGLAVARRTVGLVFGGGRGLSGLVKRLSRLV